MFKLLTYMESAFHALISLLILVIILALLGLSAFAGINFAWRFGQFLWDLFFDERWLRLWQMY